MTASREAYDLHNPACRANAWYRLKRGDWKRLRFLRLIWSDTINNVCTVRNANKPSGEPPKGRLGSRTSKC